MVCILGWTRCYDDLSKKWSKMATAVHLSTNSSEITLASNLDKAYSSEGVPTLNVASKVEFPKSLWSTVQSHKVQEAKIFETTVILLLLVYKCTAVTIFGHFLLKLS